MSHVFISYSHEDRDVARRYASALEAAGLAVWWDDHLRSGEAFDEKIEAALRVASAVVVLWSRTSVTSRWVRAEATLADRNKTLVPVMIEPCERPIMFELSHTSELGHWRGDAADAAWLGFLGDVKRLAAKDAGHAMVAPARALRPASVQETLKPGQSGSAPSLAVLPFSNRSQLPEDEVFADGMVEDVISALAQGVNVRVLGSTATANLSRSAITDLAAVGRQLGVRYLLEGNVRRVGANLRVTTQLLEAATGEVVWTGRFDRPLTELAELQEQLVTEIAASLDAQVYGLEMERALKKPVDLTAWEAVTRAFAVYRRFDADSLEHGTAEAERAVAIAPDYGLAHAALANSLANAYISRPDDPAEARRIRATAERALALSPDDALVLGYSGYALCVVGAPDEGERFIRRAIRKAPGGALLQYHCGFACGMLDRPEEALRHMVAAAELAPGWILMWAVRLWESRALWELGRRDEAQAALDEGISLNPTFGFFHALKAFYCEQLGRVVEAGALVATARRHGWDHAATERFWRRVYSGNPGHQASLAVIRDLYAAS